MPQREDELRGYADAVLATVPPVTADEARRRAGRGRGGGTGSGSRLVMLAAALVMVVMAAGLVALQAGGGDGDVTASMRDPGPWALDLDGHQAWMLELLNGTHEVDDSQVRARLADSFLAQVSPDGLASVVVGVSGRPWTVAAVVEDRPAARALELVSPSGEHLRLTLATDADGRLLGATVLGSTPCPDAVAPDDAELSPALASGLLWLTSVVEADRDVSPDELAERIHPDFLSEVGADAFAAGLDDIQALGPLELRFFERRPTATRLVARVGVFSGEEARVRLEVEEGGMGRITAASVITTSPCYAPG